MSQDVTVDVQNPRTLLDLTAIGVLNALQGGQWVFTQWVDQDIIQAGGNPQMKPMAIKALRNQGYAIAAVKARQESRYRLDATAHEMDDWRDERLTDALSGMMTIARSLAGALTVRPNDRTLAASLAAAETAVIQMGRTQGVPLADIVQSLAPL